MKKIFKLFLIIILTLFISGCTVKYDLTIDNNGMYENIRLYFVNNAENNKLVDSLYSQNRSAYYDFDTNMTNYYKTTKGIDKDHDLLYLNYYYEYNENKLQNSNAINECFYNKSVTKDEKYITLNTSKGLDCIYRDTVKQIDKLEINIKTKYLVVESNADSVSKNTYTWKITDKNYNEKSIYMKIDYKNNYKEETPIYIILVLFGIVIGGFILIIALKLRRNRTYDKKYK